MASARSINIKVNVDAGPAMASLSRLRDLLTSTVWLAKNDPDIATVLLLTDRLRRRHPYLGKES